MPGVPNRRPAGNFWVSVLIASRRSSYRKRINGKDDDMKLETINTDGATSTKQNFRRLRKLEEYPKHEHVSLRFMSPPAVAAASREYWRGLRAAEMAAWTQSGGDYLLSRA